MHEAALKFGDGETLPFTPCKKGYQPLIGTKRMYACPLHDKERRRRLQKEREVFRKGEFDLNFFWEKQSRNVETVGSGSAKKFKAKEEKLPDENSSVSNTGTTAKQR